MVYVLKYPMSNAKWMDKVIHSLKIYLYHNQFISTSKRRKCTKEGICTSIILWITSSGAMDVSTRLNFHKKIYCILSLISEIYWSQNEILHESIN